MPTWTLIAALGVVLGAIWRLHEAVQRLQSERVERETQLAEVREELEARIRRLMARETYWRGRAEPQAALLDPPTQSSGESVLDMRRRIRGG